MARKQGATREFVTSGGKKPQKHSQTSAAYRKAQIAKARQKREIEHQKKEKLIFALFVVIILVMILFAILIFKNLLGSEENQTTDQKTEDVAPTGNPSPEFDTVSIAKSAVNTGNLILINDEKTYTAKPGNLKNIYRSRQSFYSEKRGKNVYSYYTFDSNFTLEENALNSLNRLANDFYEATGNNDLHIFRAYSEDSAEHQKGTAVDINIYTLENQTFPLDDGKFASVFKWFFDNYHRYGFIMRFPNEKSDITGVSDHECHFRYVGVPHSTYMYENGLCLEEYIELLKDTQAAAPENIKPLTVTLADGSVHNLYYVPADGDVTEVSIIGGEEYTVSGDNDGGFIVSVKLS